jgi:hypothetical protein
MGRRVTVNREDGAAAGCGEKMPPAGRIAWMGHLSNRIIADHDQPVATWQIADVILEHEELTLCINCAILFVIYYI